MKMTPFGLEHENKMFISIGKFTAAEWSTSFINNLPDSSFAYIESGGKKDSDGKTVPRSLRHLPYKNADGEIDAPHTRNALARLDATNIPDSVKPAIKKKLTNALESVNKSAAEGMPFSLDPDDILQDIPDLPNVLEMLPTGDWDTPGHGKFSVTAQDLQTYITNSQTIRKLPLPIDYDHGEYRGQAAGWVTSLFIAPSSSGDGSQSLWGSVTWTPQATQAIESGEYKYFSPEWWPVGYEDPQTGAEADCVLIGGGIVNQPLFTQLTPIQASEKKKGLSKVLTANSNQHTLYLMSTDLKLEDIAKKASDKLDDAEKEFLIAHEKELNDEAKKKFASVLKADDSDDDAADKGADNIDNDADEGAGDDGEDNDDGDDTDDTDDNKADLRASGKIVSISASEFKSLKAAASQGAEAMQILRSKHASETTKSWLYNKEDGGKFPITAHEILTDFYLSLNPKQIKAFEKIVEALPNAQKLFTEFGRAVDDADSGAADKIQKLASEKMEKDKNLTYDKAMRLVAKENPSLYQQYSEELKPSKGVGQ